MTTFSSPGKYPNTPRVTTQADLNNTLGSVNPLDSGYSVNSPTNVSITRSSKSVDGGEREFREVLQDPTFAQNLGSLAIQTLCGGEIFPECPDPQELGTYSVTVGFNGRPQSFIGCICPDNSFDLFDEPKLQDSDFQSALEAFEKYQQELVSNAFSTCYGNSWIDQVDFFDLTPEQREVANIIADQIKSTLEDMNQSPEAKKDIILGLITQLIAVYTMLGVDSENLDTLNNNLNTISDQLNSCIDSINNSCDLSTKLTITDLRLASNLLSNKREKTCPDPKILNEQTCECVCPSGSVECSNGECIACSGGEILTEKSQANPDGSFSTSCSCECPEGTIRYNIPTNMGPRPDGMQMTPCVPKCPEGFIFKEIPMGSGGPSDCTYVIDDRCYDCVCRKGPSNYWQNPTLFPEEACPSGSIPDPNNECSCKCDNPLHVYYDEGSSEELPPGCYCGIELQLPTSELRSAYCNNVQLPLDGDTSEVPSVNNGIQWDHELCECVCPSGSTFVRVGECACSNPNHVWAGFKGCICPAEYQMDEAWNPSEYCNTEATGKTWDNEICECVCPSGTNYDSNIEECVCATGATVTSPGAPSSSADCVCPSGQVIAGNRESGYYCASGSYSYTSNIYSINNLGYIQHNTVELL